MTAYRAANKRLIHRAGSGRFHRSALADIGMGCCETCGKLFTIDLSGLGNPIDPKELRDRQQFCFEHRP